MLGPHSLWHLGYLDQALTMSRRALTMAQDLAHPFSLAAALDYAAMLHQFRRNLPFTSRPRLAPGATQVIYVLPGVGDVHARLGQRRARPGRGRHGPDAPGLAAYGATGAALRLPYHLARLAEACGHTGQAAAGLTLPGRGAGTSATLGSAGGRQRSIVTG